MLLEEILGSLGVPRAVSGGRSQRRKHSGADTGMRHQRVKCYRGEMGERIRQQAGLRDGPVLSSGEEEEDEEDAGRQQGRGGKPYSVARPQPSPQLRSSL